MIVWRVHTLLAEGVKYFTLSCEHGAHINMNAARDWTFRLQGEIMEEKILRESEHVVNAVIVFYIIVINSCFYVFEN